MKMSGESLNDDPAGLTGQPEQTHSDENGGGGRLFSSVISVQDAEARSVDGPLDADDSAKQDGRTGEDASIVSAHQDLSRPDHRMAPDASTLTSSDQKSFALLSLLVDSKENLADGRVVDATSPEVRRWQSYFEAQAEGFPDHTEDEAQEWHEFLCQKFGEVVVKREFPFHHLVLSGNNAEVGRVVGVDSIEARRWRPYFQAQADGFPEHDVDEVREWHAHLCMEYGEVVMEKSLFSIRLIHFPSPPSIFDSLANDVASGHGPENQSNGKDTMHASMIAAVHAAPDVCSCKSHVQLSNLIIPVDKEDLMDVHYSLMSKEQDAAQQADASSNDLEGREESDDVHDGDVPNLGAELEFGCYGTNEELKQRIATAGKGQLVKIYFSIPSVHDEDEAVRLLASYQIFPGDFAELHVLEMRAHLAAVLEGAKEETTQEFSKDDSMAECAMNSEKESWQRDMLQMDDNEGVLKACERTTRCVQQFGTMDHSSNWSSNWMPDGHAGDFTFPPHHRLPPLSPSPVSPSVATYEDPHGRALGTRARARWNKSTAALPFAVSIDEGCAVYVHDGVRMNAVELVQCFAEKKEETSQRGDIPFFETTTIPVVGATASAFPASTFAASINDGHVFCYAACTEDCDSVHSVQNGSALPVYACAPDEKVAATSSAATACWISQKRAAVRKRTDETGARTMSTVRGGSVDDAADDAADATPTSGGVVVVEVKEVVAASQQELKLEPEPSVLCDMKVKGDGKDAKKMDGDDADVVKAEGDGHVAEKDVDIVDIADMADVITAYAGVCKVDWTIEDRSANTNAMHAKGTFCRRR